MCGIYGSTMLFSKDVVKEKLKIANFRGPDFSDSITYSDKLILGHNRLSIFDLEKRSNQPLNYNGISITFNGEIYNFMSLRNDLEIKGYKFFTNSDTEVICAAYLEFGENCVDYFIGMFSFVIYDKEKNILFGARDRMGQKPFYYYHNKEHFEFASNLKQLAYKNDFILDEKTCVNYFYFGYFVDPETPYKNVYKLEPGKKFTYCLNKNSMSISSYWSIEKKTKSVKITYEESKTELKKILKEAVSHRLKADVPLGLFLSGGIDSSLISAMAKEVKSDVKTYSIKFLEKKFDESDDSKKIAKYLGTNHHTFVCDLEKGKELIETFYKYYDEPFADVSALPSMLLSNEVKKDVTVALTGDGADEFFIGYSRYKWMNQLKEIYKLPYWLRKSVGFIGGKLPIYKLQMLSKGIIFKSLDSLYFGLITTFKTDYIRLKPNYDFKKISKKYFKNSDLLKACSLFDMQVYLNSDINTKVDRASMAYSLETRSPFMDHKVIEFALKIPTNHKFKNNKTKYILKDILEDYMPKDLFDRPKKGFGVPLESWLKKDLKPLVLDCYDSFKKRDFKYINYQSFDKLLREFYNNKANHSVEIWRMVMFILWLKENEI